MNILGKLPFSRKSNREKEKSVVLFTHEQNIFCSQTSQTQLDDVAHEKTIICRPRLFAGHVMGSPPMKTNIGFI